jgi:hypothetical protein
MIESKEASRDVVAESEPETATFHVNGHECILTLWSPSQVHPEGVTVMSGGSAFTMTLADPS